MGVGQTAWGGVSDIRGHERGRRDSFGDKG